MQQTLGTERQFMRPHRGGNQTIGGFPPKWMGKIMENPIKMDDLGSPPVFLETPIEITNTYQHH